MTTTLPRITARVDIATQDLLSKAAALAGMPSINAFVLSAAVEKAQRLIEREQLLKRSQANALLLMQVLEQPAKMHSPLQQAALRYEGKTQ